jgi:hypothetical protein
MAQLPKSDKSSIASTGKVTTCEDAKDEHFPGEVPLRKRQIAVPSTLPGSSDSKVKQDIPAPKDSESAVLVEKAKQIYSSICILKAKMDTKIAHKWKELGPSTTLTWLRSIEDDEIIDKHGVLVQHFKDIANTLQKQGLGKQVPRVDLSVMEDLEF